MWFGANGRPAATAKVNAEIDGNMLVLLWLQACWAQGINLLAILIFGFLPNFKQA